MGFIIVSLFFLTLSVFGVLLCVNYAWVLWEKARVDDLTSKIKPTESDILSRKKQHKEFTASFDIRSLGKSSFSRAQNVYAKTMVAIKDKEYPGWLATIIATANVARKNVWQTIKHVFQYLLHLAKPDEHDDPNIEKVRDEEEEVNVDKTIDKVRESSQNAANTLDEEAGLSNAVEPESHAQIFLENQHEVTTDGPRVSITFKEPQTAVPDSQEEVSAATLHFAAQGNSQKQNSAFDKMENRILDKLKQSGLKNYDIWLELGELYIKYNEKEKASEVFALVLKHTADQKQKELARNRLIGI